LRRYKLAAAAFARNYQSRALGGFEQLLYWTEYVGENHGARGIKQSTAVRDMNIVRRLGLDVPAVTAGVAVLFAFILSSVLHYRRRTIVAAVNTRTKST
jgi:hypothetical protein